MITNPHCDMSKPFIYKWTNSVKNNINFTKCKTIFLWKRGQMQTHVYNDAVLCFYCTFLFSYLTVIADRFVVIIILTFAHSCLISRFLSRVTRRAQLVEQELNIWFQLPLVVGFFYLILGFLVVFSVYVCLIVLFNLARFVASGYPFGCFEPFCFM